MAPLGPPYPSAVPASHGIGLNCVANKTNSVSVRHDQAGRGPPGGSPAESIKRMSVMVNSGDSTLSLGPFIHQAGELPINAHGGYSHAHTPLDKLIGKKRKCSPGSGSVSSGTRPTKVPRSPAVNNLHVRHTGSSPGAPALVTSSLLHQVGSGLRAPGGPTAPRQPGVCVAGSVGLAVNARPAPRCPLKQEELWP